MSKQPVPGASPRGDEMSYQYQTQMDPRPVHAPRADRYCVACDKPIQAPPRGEESDEDFLCPACLRDRDDYADHDAFAADHGLMGPR